MWLRDRDHARVSKVKRNRGSYALRSCDNNVFRRFQDCNRMYSTYGIVLLDAIRGTVLLVIALSRSLTTGCEEHVRVCRHRWLLMRPPWRWFAQLCARRRRRCQAHSTKCTRRSAPSALTHHCLQADSTSTCSHGSLMGRSMCSLTIKGLETACTCINNGTRCVGFICARSAVLKIFVCICSCALYLAK